MVYLEINNMCVELTDDEARDLVRRLIAQTRTRIFFPVAFRFDRWYSCWRYHHQAHGGYFLVRAISEALGGVELPPPSQANRLKRTRDQLERLLNPRGIVRFWDLFGRWQRDATLFSNRMVAYQDGMEIGNNRAVRVLEITRDVSFITLQVCAALSTGGASAAASSAGTALARTAATNFVINEMQNSATRLGRSLSGDPPTVEETVDEVVTNVINSVSGAALQGLFAPLMAPISESIESIALRELQRGNLARAVSVSAVQDRLDNIVQQTVTQFLGTSENDIRRLVRECREARNRRELSGQMAQRLMQHRRFRQRLERNIEQAAARGR